MVLSVTQNPPEHRPLLVQAPVRALDPDGLAVVSSGTVAFAIGVVVCWVLRDTLAATGRSWYLYVAITGTAIGLIGLGVGLFRGRHRRRGPQRASVEETLVDTDGVPDRD
jgi:hypothetical protein